MSTLSTSVQVITKNKTYYLKTNLGLMKTRGEILSASSGYLRVASEDEEYRNIHVVSTCLTLPQSLTKIAYIAKDHGNALRRFVRPPL